MYRLSSLDPFGEEALAPARRLAHLRASHARANRRREGVDAIGLAPLALLAACGGGGGAASIPAPPTISGQADTVPIAIGTTSVTGNVLTNDSTTGGTLSVSAIALSGGTFATLGEPIVSPSATFVINSTGAYTFTLSPTFDATRLAAGQTIDFAFTYTPAVEGRTGAPQPLVFRITGVNDAPVAMLEIADITAEEGVALSTGIASAAFSDPDTGATLTLAATLASGGSLPAWLTFDAAAGLLSGTPGFADSGTLTVRITATDAGGLAAFQDVDVRVANVLTGIVADGYLQSALVFLDLNGDGQFSNGEPSALTDMSGRFRLASPVEGTLRAVGGINADTGVTNIADLAAFPGSTVINPLTTMVQAVVAAGLSAAGAQASVRTAFGLLPTVDINHFDILAQSPSSPAAIAAQKAAASIVAIVSQVEIALGNNGSAPAAEAAVVQQFAAMVSAATGPLDLTSAAMLSQLYASTGQFSADAVTRYAAAAQSVNQAIMAATSFAGIAGVQMIAGTNKAPVAGESRIVGTEDQPLVFDPRADDLDADNDILSVVAINNVMLQAGQPFLTANGAITVGSDGRLTFTPNADYNGLATFSYTVGDGKGGTATSAFVLDVRNAPDIPIGGADSRSAVMGSLPIGGNVLLNDSDIDASALSVTQLNGTPLAPDPDPGAGASPGYAGNLIFAAGTYGTLYLQDNGVYSYTINALDPDTAALGFGQTVTESFTYTLRNAGGLAATAILTISVSRAPIGATSGDDDLLGTAGADTILGLDGDDVIEGRGGADTIDGGSGNDTATFAGAPTGIRVSLNNPALNTGDAAGDTFVNIERIVGSGFNDTLLGDSGPNSFLGADGNDQLSGGDGIDTLDGGSGDDTIAGGLGGDQINGGLGIDYADYGFSPEAVVVDLGSGTVSGGDAAGDALLDIEALIGSDFADTLIGSAGSNVLFSGYGADTLTGGAGADDFMFDLLLLVNGEADVVTDFQHGVDRLVMRGGDVDVNFDFISGANPVASGSGATYLYNTTTGLLSYSVLAAGLREVAVFTGIPPLDASNIVVI